MIYKISKNILVVFHNGSTYDYHFITKDLAKEFEGQFECLGENTEKYITFSVQINKEVIKIDEYGNNKAVNIPLNYNLLTVLDFCQLHYQILLIIFLMDYIAIHVQIVSLILTI